MENKSNSGVVYQGKIPGRVKYCFAFGALGKDLIYGMIATFSMIYFTDIIKVAPAFIGTMFFVAKLWDAFNDLFMGMIVDNTRSRWGKFVPWLVIGTLINSFVFVTVFTDFHLSGVSLCVFASVVYVLWGMTYTIMDIPYWSIIPNLTSDPEEREKVSVLPRIFASIGQSLIIAGFGVQIIKGLGGNYIGYHRFALIIAATFIWIILLMVGIFLVFMDILLFHEFTNPVYRLLNTMREFGKGNYQAKAEENGIGELKILSAHFNIMAEKLQKQMDEIRNNEREQRKMEKKLLQSQINPHFLYNTLDSIIWMIQGGEYKGAEQMVSLLAKFFRISLSQGQDIIPLKKELEHATSYLSIQNIRFKDKFDFSVQADENLLQYLCPKLSIQPLLENAIYHGMEGIYDDGEIQISIYEKNSLIHIDVIDNGLGMPPETIEYIMHNKVVSSKRGSGIGVRNVDERIKLIFGNAYGVVITSELDEGTTASIIIPKIKKVEDIGY